MDPQATESDGLREDLLDKLAELVGLEVDDLDPSMHLEAELGLDSLKMLGLWNNLMALLPPAVAEEMAASGSPNDVVNIQTLGELMDFFLDKLGPGAGEAGAEAPAKAGETAPPMISESDPGGRPFPMAKAQRLFLLTHQIVNSTSLCSAIRLTGPLDLGALHRAWQRLIDRHVNLRTCFYYPPGCSSFADVEYRLLDAPQIPNPAVQDISGLPEAQRAQAVEEEFTRLLNRYWDLRRWPLHEFSVLRTGPDDQVLFLSNEHIVSDGLGNQILLREILALYQEEVTGIAAGLPPALDERTYEAEVAKINAYADPEETAALERFNREQGRENYVWNPGGVTLEQQLPHFVNRRYELDAAATAALTAASERTRLSLYSLMVGALVRAVSRVDDSGRAPMVQLPTSGIVYPDVDLSRAVGCFAQNLSLRFARPDAGETPEQTAGRVHKAIEEALTWGYDRELTRQMDAALGSDFALDQGRVPEYALMQMRRSLRSNLYFPFTGHTRIAERYGSLSTSDYRAATTNVIGVLDILQEIHGERLHIFANFDRQGFTDDQIDRLVDAYREELAAMAAGEAQAAPAEAAAPAPEAGATAVAGLLEIAGQVLSVPVDVSRLDDDMETRLGVDSLERIRLVTQLGKHYGTDRRKLFGCRTLAEMARVLAQGKGAAPASPKPEGTAARPAVVEAEGIDPQLPPLPYLHIAAQAKRTPDAEAVRAANAGITYGELDDLSDRLANYLAGQGIKQGDLVGILSRRGPDMLMGILGILKSGAAYVPVDPDYPDERIAYILGHAAVRFLLTQKPLLQKVEALPPAETAAPVPILLDAASTGSDAAKWRDAPADAPGFEPDPNSLMVVLYTSGSTGRPKGVALDHLGYMNRLAWHQKVFRLQPGERVAQKTSCCFDISVWELLWPLMMGGVVCAIERDQVRNPWTLSAWMQEEGINIMHFVPSMFTEFVHAHEGETLDLPALRWLIFSGEVLPVTTMQEWIDRQGLSIGLANLYGPTEASIDVTYHIIEERPGEEMLRIPIGKAIDNVQLLILDNEGKVLPHGEQGELTLGGIQLAHGYLKDPEKTAKAFIPNVYPGIPGKHVYRTGDLAVMQPDGTVDYFGRMDSQIKLRGYRVELGEIEGVMGTFPGISEAAALAVTVRDQTKLVAYYAGNAVDENELRDWVARRLADYMVPQILIHRERLPKNHNGKLDRNALRDSFERGETAPAAAPAAAPAEAAPEADTLPLAPAQKWLVSYFDEPFRWWGYSRLVLHDRLDIDAFTKALELLIGQHQALHTVFERRNGHWVKVPLWERPKFEPELYEARNIAPEECDRLIRKAIQAAAERLRVDRWPLIAVLIVKLGPEHFDISVVSHHIIGDLVAGNIMARSLWQHYRTLLDGKEPDVPPVPGTNELCARLIAMEEEGEMDQHLAYWQQAFPGPDAGFGFPVDQALGENIEAVARIDSFRLDKEETLFLLSRVKAHFGSSLYHLLLAPLYRLLAERTGQNRVVLSQRVSGRDALSDHVYFDSVDNFAVNYPLALELDRHEPVETTLANVRRALEGVPLKGVSYDWLSDRLPSFMYPDSRLTPIRVNYLGNISVPSSSTLELRPEDNNQRLTPDSQRCPAMIECRFSVLDERLRLDLCYSGNFYRSETIEALGEDYLQRLRTLIDTVREAST